MNTEEQNLNNAENPKLGISDVIGSIISEFEGRVFNLSTQNSKMKVSDFKELPEVKEIMTTISVLEKYYR